MPSRVPKSISNTFTKINGRLKLVKTFDFGIQLTTKKKFQNLSLNQNSKFTTHKKKKKLEIEENAPNAPTLTPRRRYLEGSRKEKKEDFDFRNILRGRKEVIQEGRKKTKEEEKMKKKEKKEEERKLLTEKENVLLLPGENLKNLIEIFEKFDNTGKKN